MAIAKHSRSKRPLAFRQEEIFSFNPKIGVARRLQSRTMARGRRKVDNIADQLKFPHAASGLREDSNRPIGIRDNAQDIYHKAVNKGLLRGRTMEEVAAASVYLASRQARRPRHVDDVARASGVNRKRLNKVQKDIGKHLDIKAPAPFPSQLVPAIATKLKLSHRNNNMARLLLSRAKYENILNASKPAGVAAAAVWLTSADVKPRPTQGQVAKAAGVNKSTISVNAKELRKVQ
tara:strand:- start:31 stop:732 length:702 start_codon:yes stop_codon:yes gene_type:complete